MCDMNNKEETCKACVNCKHMFHDYWNEFPEYRCKHPSIAVRKCNLVTGMYTVHVTCDTARSGSLCGKDGKLFERHPKKKKKTLRQMMTGFWGRK